MIEGLWTGEWEWESKALKVEKHGAGVFYFKRGRIYGGDARYYYSGEYKLQEARITAVFTFTHYSGERMELLGNLDEGQISLSGEVTAPNMKLAGQIGSPAVLQFRAKLTRRGDL